MTDTTRDHLLHLVDRARRGVALPEELDQLATGITKQAARIATLEHVAAGNKRHVQLLVPDLWKAEAAIERVRLLCELTIGNSVRAHAVQQALDTLAALDEPQQSTEETHVVADDSDEPEHVDGCPGCEEFTLVGHIAMQQPTTPPAHLAKGTNAEDCPACKGTNPPYPFLCPGPEQSSTITA